MIRKLHFILFFAALGVTMLAFGNAAWSAPFTSTTVQKAELSSEGGQTKLEIQGLSTLATGDTIDPLTETVQLSLGSIAVTIPVGSFSTKTEDGTTGFNFEGELSGSKWEVYLVLNESNLKFKIEGERVTGAGTTSPQPFTLSIGDSASGEVSAPVEFGKGDDEGEDLEGTNGDDDIQGGSGDDTMDGGSGNDSLDGEEGNDTIKGGPGKDVLNGGPGNDKLIAGTEADKVHAGPGNDQVFIAAGDVPAGRTENIDCGPGMDQVQLRNFSLRARVVGGKLTDPQTGGTYVFTRCEKFIRSQANAAGLALTEQDSLSNPTVLFTLSPMTNRSSMLVQTQGADIQSLRLEVFDLSGHEIFDSGPVVGRTLEWRVQGEAGETLPNGVYLYVVHVRNSEGQVIRNEVKKFAFLR